MVKYLKSVYLQGFKSFPIKTQIDLVEGITGIVGANGSGKSNVVEAIKWVLGEQSAKSLRGDKMEDVIFNGTKDRVSMSMAEVSLIFDNENHWLPIDYSEVAVSRRIFRSGEGQYSINKSRVRLKDVVELFLDTGIGRDSYAIFEQGKIDRLLSESPQERRTLFEDFAGISKFKYRKEEAEKKLENSAANIERINDVILGLEKEVVSLKEQAENAHLYQEVKAGLKSLELKFEVLRKINFESEIANKLAQRKQNEDKLNPLMEELKDKEEKIIQCEENIQTEETDYNKIRDEYVKIEREFGELKSRLENNKERKKSLEGQVNNIGNRLHEGDDRLKTLENELSLREKEYNTISEEKEEVTSHLHEIESKIDQIHLDIKKLDAKILNRSKTVGFEKIISKDNVDKNKQDLIAYQTKLENYRASLEEKWNQLKNIEQQMEEKNTQLALSNQAISALTEELKKVLQEIEGLQSREKALKLENQNLNDKTKKIQEESKQMDRVIIDSLEKQAALLKEFAKKKPDIEAGIDSIFNELINMIQKNMPLEGIKNKMSLLKTQFGQFKDYYESILNVLYSDEGTYTKKDALNKESEDIGRQIFKNEEESEGIRLNIKELQEVREGIQNNYNKNQYEAGSVKNDLNKLTDQFTSTQEAFKMIENQINDTSEKIKTKQNQTEEMMQIIDEYEEEILEMKSNRNSLLEELNNKKINFARVDEKYNSLTNEITRINNQMSDLTEMKSTYQTDKNNALSSIKELDARVKKDDSEQEQFIKKIENYKDEIEKKKGLIEKLQKTRKLLDIQRKETDENRQRLEKIIINLDNALSERKGFLESIIENAIKNYGVDINTITIEKEDNFENISAKINDLRMELQRLGNVNLLAIEQYQNAKERLEFLAVQKQDSEKAIADIVSLIDETNKRCIEQFTSSFEDIRKAFKKIFSRLFDGGRADLMLEDENDVLNSGVNIFAEPPGKKFQSISLLSGGERALVAIAVIFSILYLKPTPFVVLDEMDAPLDDDNIERFKALLRDFRETSQFIIVSHSKSTLEICDALYGVTMEEQGVSKIINVEFDEADILFKALDNNTSQSE